MNLVDVQSFIAGRISGDAVLGLLGAPLEYSLLDDEHATTATLKERLAAHGVAFVVDPPYAEGASTSGLGAALLNVVVSVKVAESPIVAHTPSGTELVSAIVRAIIARTASGKDQVAVRGFDAEIDESGYVLHVLEFAVASVVP